MKDLKLIAIALLALAATFSPVASVAKAQKPASDLNKHTLVKVIASRTSFGDQSLGGSMVVRNAFDKKGQLVLITKRVEMWSNGTYKAEETIEYIKNGSNLYPIGDKPYPFAGTKLDQYLWILELNKTCPVSLELDDYGQVFNVDGACGSVMQDLY